MKTLLLLAAPLTLAPATRAFPHAAGLPCLWDRDTLRVEAEGQEALLHTLLGRFDQFPDEYYEARLARVTKEIASQPGDLSLYDDAGVACDRIGRAKQALAWMAKKRKALDGLATADTFHEYTYLANLGTFHVHRWLREGRDRTDLADVQRAHALITKAIELNPKAHFGRERYQLLAIEELLEPQQELEDVLWEISLLTRVTGKNIHALFSQEELDEAGYSDAVEGVSGLIRLGAAWDSAAIWLALDHALLAKHDSFLARFASLRVCEIAKKGKRYHPFNGFSEESQLDQFRATVHSGKLKILDAWWKKARSASDKWRASRNGYLLSRVKLGLHPDTHPDFWSAWKDEHPLPEMPKKSFLTKLLGG